jgi:hypothetical protein
LTAEIADDVTCMAAPGHGFQNARKLPAGDHAFGKGGDRAETLGTGWGQLRRQDGLAHRQGNAMLAAQTQDQNNVVPGAAKSAVGLWHQQQGQPHLLDLRPALGKTNAGAKRCE